MKRGFAFIPVIAIAIAAIIAGSTGFSLLREKPDSALYGVQRTAETAPTNVLRYTADYEKGLKEKRVGEVRDVLRSEGRDAALAFAQKEGMLTEKARLDIAQYVPIMDGVKENIVTVFRLTTPEEVSPGKEIALVKGTRVKVKGTDLVLEAGERQVPGKELEYRLFYAGDTLEYKGSFFRLLNGGLAISDNGTRITRDAKCYEGRCIALANPTGYDWAFLRISEPKSEPQLTSYLVSGKEYLRAETLSEKYLRLVQAATIFGRYDASFGLDGDVIRVKVSPVEGKRYYIKVCESRDYAANAGNCGKDLKRITATLSDNGAAATMIYHTEISRLENSTKNIVCVEKDCVQGNDYVALFSGDGTKWAVGEKSTEPGICATLCLTTSDYLVGENNKLVKMYFNLVMMPPGRYLEMLLPEGRYGLNQDGNNPNNFYAIIDTANAETSLEYGLLSRRYIESMNIYGDIYGLEGADQEVYAALEKDTVDILKSFHGVAGRIPGTSRIKLMASANPFESPLGAGWYGGGRDGITLTSWAWGNASLCHELAHGLQKETGNIDLGSAFNEGFAQYFCVHLGYAQPGIGLPEDFRGCIERFEGPHDLGYCIFQNIKDRGFFSDSFFKRLLDAPCELRAGAELRAGVDLKTDEGKNIWYYVLSNAAGKKVEDFPHSAEIDYCAPPLRKESVRSVREEGLGKPFRIKPGGIIRIKESGDYVTLSGLGKVAKVVKERFKAKPGELLVIDGKVVALKSIVQGKNSTWEVVFEAGSTIKTVYWEGSLSGDILTEELYVLVRSISRDEKGMMMAEGHVELVLYADGINVEYIGAPKGNESSRIISSRILLGQRLQMYGTTYDLELVDIGTGEAEIVVHPSVKGIELLP